MICIHHFTHANEMDNHHLCLHFISDDLSRLNKLFLSFLLLAAVFGSSRAVQWESGTCPNYEDLPRFVPGQGRSEYEIWMFLSVPDLLNTNPKSVFLITSGFRDIVQSADFLVQLLMLKYFYERKTLNNFLLNGEGKCNTLYSSSEHGVFSIMYEGINNNSDTKLVYGVARIADNPNFTEKKIFDFKLYGNNVETVDLPAITVATDQVNYVVTYSCRQMNDPDSQETKKLETVWVHTAKRGDTSYDGAIKRDLEALGLDYETFKVTDQNDCPDK